MFLLIVEVITGLQIDGRLKRVAIQIGLDERVKRLTDIASALLTGAWRTDIVGKARRLDHAAERALPSLVLANAN